MLSGIISFSTLFAPFPAWSQYALFTSWCFFITANCTHAKLTVSDECTHSTPLIPVIDNQCLVFKYYSQSTLAQLHGQRKTNSEENLFQEGHLECRLACLFFEQEQECTRPFSMESCVCEWMLEHSELFPLGLLPVLFLLLRKEFRSVRWWARLIFYLFYAAILFIVHCMLPCSVSMKRLCKSLIRTWSFNVFSHFIIQVTQGLFLTFSLVSSFKFFSVAPSYSFSLDRGLL